MTLEEFRESLDRERWVTLAQDKQEPETVLMACEQIQFGESRNTKFMVSTGELVIYEGQNFSTATRRYWEIAHRGKQNDGKVCEKAGTWR